MIYTVKSAEMRTFCTHVTADTPAEAAFVAAMQLTMGRQTDVPDMLVLEGQSWRRYRWSGTRMARADRGLA